MSREESRDRRVRPDEELAEEALLFRAWAESGDPAGAGPDREGREAEIPEELLGVLDGTLRGDEARRALDRLADDPPTARRVGELAASLRDLPDPVRPIDPPRTLLDEALGLVAPPVAPSRTPAWLKRLWQPVEDVFRHTRAPLLAAGAIALLLVVVAVRDSERTDPGPPAFRAVSSAPGAIVRVSPEENAELRGEVRFRWEPLGDAARYRVTLVDPAEGKILALGPVEEASLVASGREIAAAFPGREPRALLWTVRALRLDGSEVSSTPGGIVWTGPSR